MSPTSTTSPTSSIIRDLIALTKPGVTRMCVFMTLGGLALASEYTGRSVGFFQAGAIISGVALCVAGANAFNMWWERDLDRLMTRTRSRPLPARRLSPRVAVRFALACAGLGALVLVVAANLLTALLTLAAVVAYVGVYTPLKVRTPSALIVGAIPGAMPPLVGWTSVSNSVDAPALVLFAILLVWQIPHFLAISIYRHDDYLRAGIKTVPVVRGIPMAKIQAVAWSMALLPLSLLLLTMGVGGAFYLTAAFLLSSGFLAWSFTGLDNNAGARWARGFFLASLVYLPALTIALIADSML